MKEQTNELDCMLRHGCAQAQAAQCACDLCKLGRVMTSLLLLSQGEAWLAGELCSCCGLHHCCDHSADAVPLQLAVLQLWPLLRQEACPAIAADFQFHQQMHW